MIRNTLIGTGLVSTLVAVGAISYNAGTTAALSATTVSQPEEMDPMMAAMMEAGTPGEQHAKLARAAGEWKAHTNFQMQPGQFEEGEGTMSSKTILDGRYTVAHFKSVVMGMPFEGMALNGYDNVKKEYFSIWIDSMSTGVMHMTGQMKGDTLVLYGAAQMPEPMGTVEMRMETTQSDDNSIHDVFYKKFDGEWVKDGEIHYTRTGAAKADH